jgi:hypothetical protein
MRHDITTNYQCWVTTDGAHFAVHNKLNKEVYGGYALGTYATFTDNLTSYRVTIDQSQKVILEKTGE